MKDSLEAFQERKKSLQDLKTAIMKRRNIETPLKDFDSLLKNTKLEIDNALALDNVHKLFGNLIKMQEDI